MSRTLGAKSLAHRNAALIVVVLARTSVGRVAKPWIVTASVAWFCVGFFVFAWSVRGV